MNWLAKINITVVTERLGPFKSAIFLLALIVLCLFIGYRLGNFYHYFQSSTLDQQKIRLEQLYPFPEVELEAAELDLTTYKDEILDLQDPLQEQLLMAIPISPICCEECLGLCPECGVNMNITRCDCVKKIFNNKFNILSELNLKKS